MKAPKSLFLAVGLGLVVSAGVWYFQGSPETRSSRFTNLLNSSNKPNSFVTPDLILLRGQQNDYDLSYSGEVPSDASSSSSSPMRFAIQGRLSIIALDELKESYKVALRFRPERFEGIESFPANFRNAWKSAIVATVSAELSRRGFQLQLSKHADLSPLAREFWQGLIQRIQVELPEILEKRTFESEEHPYGTIVLARYEIDPSVALSSLNSERLYIQKSFQSREGSDRQISGETLAVMREGLQGIYQLETKMQEALRAKGLNLPSRSEMKLQWIRQDRVSDEELAHLDVTGPKAGELAVETAIQQQALGTLTFPDIWARIEALGRESVVPQELYLQMKAWIFLHPKDLEELKDKLSNLGPEDGRLRNVIKALTAVGSEEAQSLLVDLLNSHIENSELAKRIATSLGFVKNPSLDSQKALQTLIARGDHPDIRAQALLALGIMGHNLHENGEAQRAADVEKIAKTFLDQAETPQDTKQALAVLGNSGPSSREVVDRYLTSPDPEIRAQALFALRFCRESDTAEFLARTYATEPADSARKSIVQALVLRPADSGWFAAVDTILKTSITSDEQIQLAQALVRNARKDKRQSLRLLGAMQQKSDDESIKKQLAQYKDQAQNMTTF